MGVVYLDGTTGQTRELQARKEVVLAGGAFDTPHLLQVSGVGPHKLLKKINVDVVGDNPHVGENRWDHISVPYVLTLAQAADDLPNTVNIDGTVNMRILRNCLESMGLSPGYCICALM